MAVVGVLSDTHGLRRPEVERVLGGVDMIIHAGDIDDADTLQWLRWLGRIVVVRGNCDRGLFAVSLPDNELLMVEGRGIYVLHDLSRITLDPRAADVAVVVHGHTHKPAKDIRDGVLYFNPGSAGPRRAGCPVTVGKLHLDAGGVVPEIIPLVSSPVGER